MEGDPRFMAARKLRSVGRNEAAVQMLSDLVLAATHGKSEEEQLSVELAPLYYEYGCALACAARGSSEEPGEEDAEQPERKKLKTDEEEAGDASVAWQLLDQARCIFEARVEDEASDAETKRAARANVAQCCVQLGDLNSDDKKWGDAIVEYTNCVEQYEVRGPPYTLDQEKRYIAALVGATVAYIAADSEDVYIGDGILVAPGAECLDRATSLVQAAEKRLNALLTTGRDEQLDRDQDSKRDICALCMELQAAKDAVLDATNARLATAKSHKKKKT